MKMPNRYYISFSMSQPEDDHGSFAGGVFVKASDAAEAVRTALDERVAPIAQSVMVLPVPDEESIPEELFNRLLQKDELSRHFELNVVNLSDAAA